MFLILKVMAERSGTRFHTPAISGSCSSVSKVVIDHPQLSWRI
ncbi:hypothetical protein L840_0258 [Mycobacterium sp. MAC_011194_8550]|nr:hypothetical protein [Mycobacterium lepraemurium]ETZ79775.1 hypothetical protein L840_0258 [Mycobacterium sp. MAC_011194_8550]